MTRNPDAVLTLVLLGLVVVIAAVLGLGCWPRRRRMTDAEAERRYPWLAERRRARHFH